MRSAEWRLFLPNDENRRHPAQVRTLVSMVEDVAPVVRTDFYVKADADVGVKRRVSTAHVARWWWCGGGGGASSSDCSGGGSGG